MNFIRSFFTSSPKVPGCLYLGICGSTRSGKSSLARGLCEHLELNKKMILRLDDYFDIGKMRDNVKPDDKYLNWEVPESLDFARFTNDLLCSPERFLQPLKTPFTLRKGNSTLRYTSIIIVEGFLLFEPGSDSELLKLFDKFIFISCTKSICKKRRMETKRETEEYFETLIWPNYLKYNHSLYKLKKSGELNSILGGGEFVAIDGCRNNRAQVLDAGLRFLASSAERTEEEVLEEDRLLAALDEEYEEYVKAHGI